MPGNVEQGLSSENHALHESPIAIQLIYGIFRKIMYFKMATWLL
jgi:hypothetical protein